MITGHFGFAAGVKAREREVPLWALMLATVWLDVVFAPLLAAGIEDIDTPGGYGKAIIHADYTHSLVGAVLLAAVFGGVAAAAWGRRVGVVLGAVVFSHWVLDLVVHRADMPILPGNVGDLPRLGFGLWRVPVASLAAELALVLVGTYMYWRAATDAEAAAGGAGRIRARTVSGGMLAAGLIVLLVDFFSE